MKSFLDYIRHFKFNNFLALLILPTLLYMLFKDTSLRDLLIVLVTLMFRYYWDTTASNSKKDETINSMAKSIPDAINNENNLNNKK